MIPVVIVAASLSCATTAEDEAAAGSAVGVPAGWDRSVVRLNEARASAMRADCTFKRGALPAESLGKELPVGKDIPVDTIVVFQQENRSFDSYFGRLGRYAGRSDIESPPEGASNPMRVDASGTPGIPWEHAPRLCMPDTNHEWGGVHLQLDDGRMDGFFQSNDQWTERPSALAAELLSGRRAMWYYDERDIPYYYELARTFAIGDHYFSSVPGPTYPNRDYLYAATSFGVTTNHAPDSSFLGPDTLIFDELERRGISWRFYTDGGPPIPRVGATLGASFISRYGKLKGDRFSTIGNFGRDAREGRLPQVVFVDASLNEDVDGTDEHPPADVQVGQKWMSERLAELMASPQWSRMAAFVTYDEHGGIYDHVVPPKACPPDDIEPVLENDEDREFPGRFDQYGMRVPFIVVSPYAKKSHVSHHVYDQTSVLRFIEARFTLPALTSRDANAEAPFDMFDFANPPFLVPPPLPAATVDRAALAECWSLLGQQVHENR